ncbi:MAG: hypothetical protein QOH30_3571 [Baekduia sp.]|nr:hypothetical protein [Baekduia sp.]
MTPDTRNRAPFELLRFTASPVSADVGVLELDGRFPQSARFTRQPVLVIEARDVPRLELAPLRADRDGERWSAVYAVPLGALDGGTFALGLRGKLLDLPAPDPADEADRLAQVAREVNGLRRGLEAAEDVAAEARAEVAATEARLVAAVAAARDEAEEAAAQRIAALEADHAFTQAAGAEHRAALEADLVEARSRAVREVEDARAEVARAQEAAHAAATARAEAAERRAEDAERRAEQAERDADAVTDERTVEAERRAEAEIQRADEAEALARTAREAAATAEAGVAVLRAELAEERERSQAVIADLQDQLAAARGGEEPTTRVAEAGAQTTTHVLEPVRGAGAGATGDADDDRPRTLKTPTPVVPTPHEPVRHHTGPSPGRWIAVAALALFFFVLLGLLLGFLG